MYCINVCKNNKDNQYRHRSEFASMKKRKITKDGISRLKNELKKIDWSNMYNVDNVNYCYNTFICKFSLLYDDCFPLLPIFEKKKKCKFKQPWMSKGLLISVRKKQKIHQQFLKQRNDNNRTKYTIYTNKLTSLLRTAKKQYYYKMFAKYKHDCKKTWSQVNVLLGKSKKKDLPCNMYFDIVTIIEKRLLNVSIHTLLM